MVEGEYGGESEKKSYWEWVIRSRVQVSCEWVSVTIQPHKLIKLPVRLCSHRRLNWNLPVSHKFVLATSRDWRPFHLFFLYSLLGVTVNLNDQFLDRNRNHFYIVHLKLKRNTHFVWEAERQKPKARIWPTWNRECGYFLFSDRLGNPIKKVGLLKPVSYITFSGACTKCCAQSQPLNSKKKRNAAVWFRNSKLMGLIK